MNKEQEKRMRRFEKCIREQKIRVQRYSTKRRAPNGKKFASDAPGEMRDLAARLKKIDDKLNVIDGKLEFLLKYLEL